MEETVRLQKKDAGERLQKSNHIRPQQLAQQTPQSPVKMMMSYL